MCAAYGAVHLELVSLLSTNDFLGCSRQIIARRGRSNIAYGDNGSNFVGAVDNFKKLNWHITKKFSSVKQIEWRFSSTTASWWVLIGLLKNMFKKVLENSA